MAQEFKEYDRKFRQFICKTLPYEADVLDELKSQYVTEWKYKDQIQAHNQQWVRYCVYLAPDAEEWQKFRVSMKGMDTKLKLLRLELRYEIATGVHKPKLKLKDMDITYASRELCRIDNYIGALQRGGLLGKEYKIIK